MRMTGRWFQDGFNKALLTYTFRNGSTIEFFSADQPDKLRGARRDILFMNEANNIPFDSYLQLAMRTKKEIWIDFNPVAEFWAHTELMDEDDSEFIILTYKDNEALEESIVKELRKAEKKAENSDYWKNWVRVYVYGEIGQLQGAIYDNWKKINAVPKDAQLLGYGLDFGFANDPAALVGVYRYNGEVIFDEKVYQTEMTNQDLDREMKKLKISKQKPIYADSAEPKSIEELRRLGWMIKPTTKGADSIKFGIDVIQSLGTFRVTRSSLNMIKELRNYVWDKDRFGNTAKRPIDKYNHCFVGNTKVLTPFGEVNIKDIQQGDLVMTPNGAKKVLHKWNNGLKPTREYSMQLDTFSLSLECTKEHKIKTKEGWKEIQKLKVEDQLCLHKSLMAKLIIYTMAKDISQKAQTGFIGLFGNTLKEKYQKTTMFTILTIILTTIISKTLHWYTSLYTYAILAKSVSRNLMSGLRIFTKKESRLLKSGISQKKEGLGTRNMVKKHGLTEVIKLKLARFAEKNTKLGMVEFQNIVMPTVRLLHLEEGEELNQEVYDLTVEDEHCYYANGVLVHNCMDAFRYFAMMRLRKKHSFFVV